MGSILEACNDPNDLIVHVNPRAGGSLKGREEVESVEGLVEAESQDLFSHSLEMEDVRRMGL